MRQSENGTRSRCDPKLEGCIYLSHQLDGQRALFCFEYHIYFVS